MLQLLMLRSGQPHVEVQPSHLQELLAGAPSSWALGQQSRCQRVSDLGPRHHYATGDSTALCCRAEATGAGVTGGDSSAGWPGFQHQL